MTTCSRFRSAEEFLKSVQQRYARPVVPAEPDPDYIKRLADIARGSEFEITEMMGHGLDIAIGELQEQILGNAPDKVRMRLSTTTAFGVLDAGTINAMVLSDNHGYFAVVLHRGLMLLLNKVAKCLIGAATPACVTYCSRKPTEALTREDVMGYMRELFDNTARYGAPYGAMLLLSDDKREEQAYLVHCCELFALCHEIGHIVNDDVDDPSRIGLFLGEDWVHVLYENLDHECEHKADAVAFDLLCQLQQCTSEADRLRMLSPVIVLFNTLYMLGGSETYSHPHPLNRAVVLAEHYFGKDRGRLLFESYQDFSLLQALFSASR